MKRIMVYAVLVLLVSETKAQLSRVHVKAQAGSTWGVTSEASSNNKVIGFTHDGTAGVISTGTATGASSNSPLRFATAGQPRMTILENGNVGIGTLAPDYEFTVAGRIYAREVKVKITAGTGPDYVFANDYSLPPLENLKIYINKFKHLPDVPSAVDMENDGVNVSEMNMLLLKKIEELTLYMIEQNAQLKALQQKTAEQEKELNELKQQH